MKSARRLFVIATLLATAALAGCDEVGPSSEDVHIESVEFLEWHDRFPTYVAHLLGRSVDGFHLDLATDIEVTNPTARKARVTLELEIPGYSSIARQSTIVGRARASLCRA